MMGKETGAAAAVPAAAWAPASLDCAAPGELTLEVPVPLDAIAGGTRTYTSCGKVIRRKAAATCKVTPRGEVVGPDAAFEGGIE